MTIDPRLKRIFAAQPYPLLLATINGAHLYGFPSPDSDFDLRGARVLPLVKVVGLDVHGRRGGEPDAAERGVWTAIHREPRGAKAGRPGEIQTGRCRHRFPRIGISTSARGITSRHTTRADCQSRQANKRVRL